MSKIVINDLGRSIARSGLLPASAYYFIEYLRTHAGKLKVLLPKAKLSRDGIPEELAKDFDPLDIAFVLIHLCFTSPSLGR